MGASSVIVNVCPLFCLVKVEDIVAMNHFRSFRKEDQYMLSHNTLPTALQASYSPQEHLLAIYTPEQSRSVTCCSNCLSVFCTIYISLCYGGSICTTSIP